MAIRSFIIATNLPIPTMGGADLRTALILRSLCRHGPVGVFGVGYRPERDPPLPAIEVWRSTPRDVAIDHNTSVVERGWISDTDWLPSDRYYSPAIAAEIARAVAHFRPDVVLLSQLGMAAYMQVAQSVGAQVVLDAHNVETLLQEEIARSAGSPIETMVRRHFAERTRRLEAATVASADAVWACSDRDRTLLRDLFEATNVSVVPNGIDVTEYDDVYASRSSADLTEPTIVFPAQFAYAPNYRAADWLLDEIAPAIRAVVDGVTIVLPGRGPSPRMLEAAATGVAVVPGPVPSMLPHLRDADLMLIPLREGSGTRLKALEAFAAGLPLISTRKGIEGLDAVADTHYVRAETSEEFANAVVRLMDSDTSDRFRQAGRSFVESRNSMAAVADAVDAGMKRL